MAFPNPSEESRNILSEVHYANLKRATEMDRESAAVFAAAHLEADAATKTRMLFLAESLRRQAQIGPRQAQYDARTVYDLSY